MTVAKTEDFYLDWFCRVHEDAAAKENRMLSEDARTAIRHIWRDHARAAAKRPALYRLHSPFYFNYCSEAAGLMSKSAQFTGSASIEESHVKAATLAMEELGQGRRCSQEDVKTGCGLFPPTTLRDRTNALGGQVKPT